MMTSIINGGLPLIMTAYLFYFRRDRGLNSLLLMAIFLSYFAYATNYWHYGLDFDLYRNLHKFIGVLAVIGLVHHLYKNNLATLKNSVCYLLLMFLLAIGASYFGNDLHMSHYLYYGRNFLFILLIVLFIYLKLDTNKKVDELLQFLVGLVLILSVFSIILAISTMNFEKIFSLNPFGTRMQLFYSNSNYLALSLMLGFSVLLFVKTEFKVMKLGLVAFAIFLTYSDTVFVCIVILLLLYTFKNRGSISIEKFFATLLVIIVANGFLFHQRISDIYHNEVRVALAKVAINAYSDNLVNGIGYGQFRTQYYKYVDDAVLKNAELNNAVLSHDVNLTDLYIENKRGMTRIMEKMTALKRGITRNMEKMTHNDLLKVIAELGSIGIVFLLFYFYKLYFELRELFSNNQEYFYISLSLLIGSLTFSCFHNNITSFVFWFILFIPFIINRNYEKIT